MDTHRKSKPTQKADNSAVSFLMCCVGCLLGWCVSGGLFFELGRVLDGTSRSCIGGWLGATFGITLLVVSFVKIRPKSNIAGFFCAGFGFGSAIVSGAMIFLSSVLPSC
jgi:hypothetical protein